MTLHLVAENLTNQVVGAFPTLTLDILKGHINDRIFALISTILLAESPDLLVFEIDRSVGVRLFKEYPQHIHVQGFPETARAGKQ